MPSLSQILDRSFVQLRIVWLSLFTIRGGIAPKLAALVGIGYCFGPIDLIPDRLPYIGHLDEIGFVLSGLLAARLLGAPELLAETADPAFEHLLERTLFTVRVLRADLANFFLFQHRNVHAFLITGKNSGTHWLKFMLSVAIAEQFGVAAPRHASGPESDAIIGHPRWPATHPHLPRVGSSHTIPSRAFAWRLPLLDHPPVVVLVRDIREAMLSNFVKWQHHYGGTLADYVRGDPLGRRHVADIWWYVHFFNRWGDVAGGRPDNTLIVRYEDLQASPEYWLDRIATHLRVPLAATSIASAMQFRSRGAIAPVLDPAYGETIIPQLEAREAAVLCAADEIVLQGILKRHLRHPLGYDYPTREPRRAAPRPLADDGTVSTNR